MMQAPPPPKLARFTDENRYATGTTWSEQGFVPCLYHDIACKKSRSFESGFLLPKRSNPIEETELLNPSMGQFLTITKIPCPTKNAKLPTCVYSLPARPAVANPLPSIAYLAKPSTVTAGCASSCWMARGLNSTLTATSHTNHTSPTTAQTSLIVGLIFSDFWPLVSKSDINSLTNAACAKLLQMTNAICLSSTRCKLDVGTKKTAVSSNNTSPVSPNNPPPYAMSSSSPANANKTAYPPLCAGTAPPSCG